MTRRTTLLLVTLALATAACATGSSGGPRRSTPMATVAEPPPSAPTTASDPPSAPEAARIVVPLPPDLGLTVDEQEALQTLANAEAFGGEAVGYAGEPVPAVVALRRLVRGPSAARSLQLVLRHGTLAAQLLALTGLYGVDPPAFQVAVQRYRGVGTMVKVNRGGCFQLQEDVPVGELVEAPGALQRARPDEPLAEWVRRNPGRKDLVLDLMGGGYSLVIVDG